MKTLELIVAGFLGIAVTVSGCASSSTSRRTTKTDISRSTVRRHSMSTANVTISLKKLETVQDLMSSTDDHIEYLNFRNRYVNHGDRIESSINQGRTDDTRRLVRELAYLLEKDNSKYAKQYLLELKNFTYTEQVVYDIKETKTSTYYTEQDVQGTVLGLLFFNPQAIVETGKALVTDNNPIGRTSTSTRNVGQKVKIYRVNPYSGTRKFVEERPYNK